MKGRIVLTHVNLTSGFSRSERQMLLLIRALESRPLQQQLVVRKGSRLHHQALQNDLQVVPQGLIKTTAPAADSDVVHAHGTEASWQWAKSSKRPFVVSVGSTSQLANKSLIASWCALVPSRSLKERVHASLLQLPIERVAPMYDDRVIHLSDAQTRLAAKLAGKFVIGVCSDGSDGSGLSYAVAAMRWLSTRNHQAHLLMVCDGKFPKSVRSVIGTLREITLVENQSDTTGWYRLFSAYLSPTTSAFDDCGVVQAMYCSLPVVATRLEAMDDFVQHKHSALLVPSMDAHALGQALLQVIEDSSTALRLGTTAYNRIEKHAPHLAGEKTFRVYQSVVSSQHVR